MTPQQYNRRLNDVQETLHRLGNTLNALQTTNPALYPGNLESLSMEAAYQAEALACRMRHILYRMSNVTRQQYLEGAMIPAGMEVRRTSCSVSLIFPALMPNRKRSASREYPSGLTYAALNRENRQEPLPKFDRCLLLVVHCFEPGWEESACPDYDNIELKAVQDLLALFLMVDDSMKYCDRLETTRTDSVRHTEFHVIRRGALLQWLNAEKAAGNRYPIFEENPIEKQDTAFSASECPPGGDFPPKIHPA